MAAGLSVETGGTVIAEERHGLRQQADADRSGGGDGGGVSASTSGGGRHPAAARHADRRQHRQRRRGARLRQARRHDHLARPQPGRQHQRVQGSPARATCSTAAPRPAAGRQRRHHPDGLGVKKTSPAINRAPPACRPTSAASGASSASAATSALGSLSAALGVVINQRRDQWPASCCPAASGPTASWLAAAATCCAGLGGKDGLCGEAGGRPSRGRRRERPDGRWAGARTHCVDRARRTPGSAANCRGVSEEHPLRQATPAAPPRASSFSRTASAAAGAAVAGVAAGARFRARPSAGYGPD